MWIVNIPEDKREPEALTCITLLISAGFISIGRYLQMLFLYFLRLRSRAIRFYCTVQSSDLLIHPAARFAAD